MSSEAITRNDLTAILNEVLPVKPSEYRTLLWTNPSPASSFAAQTISLDLSNYDCVEIEAYLSANGMTTTRMTEAGKMGEVGGLGSAGDRYARMATVSATGITFTAGTTNGTTNNANAIPYKIYGIKYMAVLPPAEDALAWKLKGTASGGNTVNMPTDYNEIMLVATGYSTYFFTAIVPKAEIGSSNIAPRFASYYNASNNAGGYWVVNSNTASLGSYQENGGINVLSQATFKLYYR